MINRSLYNYIQEFPTLSEEELELKFIKDTIENIGKVAVSLEEAEDIWSCHSLSLYATWLGISQKETMKGLYEEIISRDVMDVGQKEDIFTILNDTTRKVKRSV